LAARPSGVRWTTSLAGVLAVGTDLLLRTLVASSSRSVRETPAASAST